VIKKGLSSRSGGLTNQIPECRIRACFLGAAKKDLQRRLKKPSKYVLITSV